MTVDATRDDYDTRMMTMMHGEEEEEEEERITMAWLQCKYYNYKSTVVYVECSTKFMLQPAVRV